VARGGVPLWAGWSGWAGRPCGALRSSFATLAGRACRPLCTGLALRTLRTDRTLRAGRANFAALAGGALGANGSWRALGSLADARCSDVCDDDRVRSHRKSLVFRLASRTVRRVQGRQSELSPHGATPGDICRWLAAPIISDVLVWQAPFDS
jgi:hypothetical protein